MEIIITQWALDSYLNLKHSNVFDDAYYWSTLRPDVMLLQTFPGETKFQSDRFWGPAKTLSGRIPDGHKMKWRQVGNGRVQLRLPVLILGDEAFLCEAYVKSDEKVDKRKMAKFDGHAQAIRQGNFIERGRLT